MSDDREVDDIARRASATAAREFPRETWNLRSKVAVALVGLLVVANIVIGIFNSIALRAQITCQHKLFNAVQQTGDQSRDINKQLFDIVLGGTNPQTGKPLTREDIQQIRKDYDKAFAANTKAREAALNSTCNDNSDYPSTGGGVTSPSPVTLIH